MTQVLLAQTTPTRQQSRRQRMRGPVLTVGGLALATAALRLRDPHDQGSWGLCPLALVGIHCPGCGGLRAVNDLTHGDLLGAASSNLAFVVALPFLVLALALWATDRWRGIERRVRPEVKRPAVVAVVVALAVFTVARNLAFGAWLAP